MKNRFKWFIIFSLLLVILSACGLNPVERIKEEAAERVAETIVEQASGVENVDIDVDGDTAAYTFDDGEGEQIQVDVSGGETVTSITGWGHEIPIPDGLTNVSMQRVSNDGIEIVQAIFEINGLTPEAFYGRMHQTLTEQGFSYVDESDQGRTQPDPSDPTSVMFVFYEHDDGTRFTIFGSDGETIFNMTQSSEE